MPISKVRLLEVCGVLVLAAGCGKYEMVTVALMTDPEGLTEMTAETGSGSDTDSTAGVPTTSGTMSGTGSGNPSSDPSGDPSGDPGGTNPDPTEQTTGPSATCDTPESCTGMESGDLGPLAVPFFRGKVCVSDKVRPGDPLSLSVSTCLHPCLADAKYKRKWAFRNGGNGLELAQVFYHPDTVGTACPSDVFGEFPAEFCVYTGPTAFTIGPVLVGDTPWEGPATLIVPFLSNADAAEFAAGMDDAANVWAKVDSHTHAPDRTFELSFDPGNAAPPAECGEGVGGCTCRAIGL